MAGPCKRVLLILCLLIITAIAENSDGNSSGDNSGGGSDGEGHGKKIQKNDYPPAGATLLTTIVFMMILNYVTNADDPDIRRYATGIIHSTMGIFCAILTQIAIIGLIVGYVDDKVSDDASILIRFAIAIFYFILLQLALAYFSNLFMKEDAYKAYHAKGTNRIRTKLNLSTACTYLAHTTAFLCINAWTNVQILKDWFGYGRGEAFVSVICTAAFIFGLRGLASLVRTVLTGMDGKLEHREEIWMEHVTEAEEDIASLLMAYILTRIVMQWIAGKFPDEEHVLEDPSQATVGYIYLFGFSSAIVSLLLVLLRPSVGEAMLKEEEEEEEEEAEGEHGHEHGHGHGHAEEGGEHGHGHGHAEEGGEHGHGHGHAEEGGHVAHEKSNRSSKGKKEAAKPGFCTKLYQRFSSTLDWFVKSCVLCLIMVFAFAIFEASEHAFMNIDSLQDDDDTLEALTLTIILSACSFALIVIVDKISDAYKTEEAGMLDLILSLIIKGAGLLVGITWEHLFEVAINQCATGAAEPHAVESALSFGAVLVVAPAWRMYIAPIVILGGWRFGMVPEMVVEKAKKLTKGVSSKPHHRKQAEEFAKEYSKIIHVLQTLHTEEHRKEEVKPYTATHFHEVLQRVWAEMDETNKPPGELQI